MFTVLSPGHNKGGCGSPCTSRAILSTMNTLSGAEDNRKPGFTSYKQMVVHAKVKKSSSPAPRIKARTALPFGFSPGPFDVICLRGGVAASHPGNARYKHILEMNLPAYTQAESRSSKSEVVSTIMNMICSSSLDGGFVTLKDGRWYQVTEAFAREKVSRRSGRFRYRYITVFSNDIDNNWFFIDWTGVSRSRIDMRTLPGH